ncbi:Rrp15p-domain-containing protein [Phyllosticta citribraziliensis]|uniref:Rrp15p-domain-containing protein n=1 Tax=Phyllosticta citribraziliensis TaxID=989973 RepID=A0ABR1MBA8_9PEZI
MPAHPSRTPVALKRRRTEQNRNSSTKRVRRIKNPTFYHSSGDEESAAEEAPKATTTRQQPAPESESKSEAQPVPNHTKKVEVAAPEPQSADDESDDAAANDEFSEEELEGDVEMDSDEEASEDGSEGSLSDGGSSNAANRNKKKRNDPDAFATSMQKILGSKLTTTKRADPILSRSKIAHDAGRGMADAKLEAKAKGKMRDEKKAQLEKGRVKDVMGLQTTDVSTQRIQEEEKRLKKTAQRGVVKLFNAVRAAQVKGEQAAREAKKTGVVGIDKREEKVTEMSKKGFLDLIAGGGKKTAAPAEA